MGRIVLESVIAAGYKTVVTDTVVEARNAASELGAIVVDTPGGVAEEADWIILSLPLPDTVTQVVRGEGGLVASMGKRHIVVDTSTVDPETTRDAAVHCESVGAAYIDAPILGRPASAGKWVLPAGGDSAVIETVSPLLRTFAKRVVRVGETGAGHTVKLLNQLMFSAINAITAEVFAVADKLGVSREGFLDALATSGAATVSGLFLECGRKIVDGDYESVFPVDLLCKDARLAVEMAGNGGAPPPIATSIQAYNLLAQAQGLGDLDTSALFNVFRDMYRENDLVESVDT